MILTRMSAHRVTETTQATPNSSVFRDMPLLLSVNGDSRASMLGCVHHLLFRSDFLDVEIEQAEDNGSARVDRRRGGALEMDDRPAGWNLYDLRPRGSRAVDGKVFRKERAVNAKRPCTWAIASGQETQRYPLGMVGRVQDLQRSVFAAPAPVIRAENFLHEEARGPLGLEIVINPVMLLLPFPFATVLHQPLFEVVHTEERESLVAADDRLCSQQATQLGFELFAGIRVTQSVHENSVEPEVGQLAEGKLQGQAGQAGVEIIPIAAMHGPKAPAQRVGVKVATEMAIRHHLMTSVPVGEEGDIGKLKHHAAHRNTTFDLSHEVGVISILFLHGGEGRQVVLPGLIEQAQREQDGKPHVCASKSPAALGIAPVSGIQPN